MPNMSGGLLKNTSRLSSDCVTFSLNGKIQCVRELPGGTSLLTYIRDVALLRGTKFMCREGGCGACIVNLTFTDPITGIDRSFGINSCLFPVYSCQGMSVTTVEGIGSRQRGYHPIQTRLAQFYGTQCGYCTPGWVMAMYSLLKSNRNLTMEEIEESLGSNNCRCTGYRPILDAFKSFADDSPQEVQSKVVDIEDMLRFCKKSGKQCEKRCKLHTPNGQDFKCKEDEYENDDLERHFTELALSSTRISVQTPGDGHWYRVSSIDEIFEIFSVLKGSYMLLAGNTAQGVIEDKYPPPPDVYIDINGVSELKGHRFAGGSLLLGANMSLSDTITLFDAVAVERPEVFSYLAVLAKHMRKVAHIPVRNIGTLAGNLSTKHHYRIFPSDLFTIYETVGARLVIDAGCGAQFTVSVQEYLDVDMYKKVIKNIIFPSLNNSYIVKTYKILRRAQNDHAIVNAGFCFSFDKANDYKILTRPRIVYGGISPDFVHAEKTEVMLKGKKLLDTKTLQFALKTLNLEVNPTRTLPEASNEYRKGLAVALLYRYVLSLNPLAINPKFRSGGEDIARPLSSGKQEYYSDPPEYPLTEPIPKIESLTQCSGEIQYTNDLLPYGNELYASLVLTNVGPSTLAGIDAKEALNIPGVAAFFSAKDIPGINSFVSPISSLVVEQEQLFADGEILYAGQCVGVVVANSQQLADFAAARVKVAYKNIRKPLLNVQEVLAIGDKQKLKYIASIKPTQEKKDVFRIIKGTYTNEGQYHYYYETQSCVVRPKDSDELEVTVSTQWMQKAYEAMSALLNISVNRINVRVLRCGGAYGGKLVRSNLPACAAALAAHLLYRPVRIVMNLESNMRAFIGRYFMYSEYEVGVNSDGEIQYLKVKYYTDKGASFNDSITSIVTLPTFPNIYDSSTWDVDLYDVKTEKSPTTLMRAPGSAAAIGLVEHIMEHIAWTLKKDPIDVRLKNVMSGSPIPEYIAEVKSQSDYMTRLANSMHFNASNQWKKRGISIVPMRYEIGFVGRYHALVSIYREDGTVVISHGGSELGQGINTKAAQVAAHVLGIPLEFVKVKSSNNLTSPDDIYTASSSTSDGICFAVRKCCEELNSRLQAVRTWTSDYPEQTWLQLIQKAYSQSVDLLASYMFVNERDLKDYVNYGVTLLEVEIDCLTGEHRIIRADVLQNLGKSISPLVDIGQIEGAFLMGLGHFTSEQLIFDQATGLLTTDRTWEYKVPGAKDIPEDWRIYFKKDPDTPPAGVYGSKSVAEAPLVMSVSVLFAIRRALESIRKDVGVPDSFFYNDPPCTTEAIFLRSNTNLKDYTL